MNCLHKVPISCLNSKSFDPHVDSILKGARRTLEASKVVATVIPIPYVDLVANPLIELIKKLEEMRSNHASLDAVSREVLQLASMISRAMLKVKEDIEVIPSVDPQREAIVNGLSGSWKLDTGLRKLHDDLETLKQKANKLHDSSWCLRFIYSSQDADTLEELRNGIKECREVFKMQVQVAIKESIDEVLKKLSDIEDRNTLDSLPHAEASYRAAVNTMKSNFLPGTRVELFQAIDDWVEQRSPELSRKAVCILTGGAGTGKSTIACEFARMRDVVKQDYGASFFFARGEENLDSTRLVFPTLAYQLAQSQDELRPHIIAAARKHVKRDKIQQMKFQAPELLHGPIQQISSEYSRMVLVIDALDECSKEMRDLVPEMLDRLMESIDQTQFSLKIFFTSRPNSVVENTLQRSQWASRVHTISLHDLPPESVKEDMAMFVRDKITKMTSGQELLKERPHVADDMARRSGSLFIYAKTAMDFLSDYPDFIKEDLDELLSEGSSSFAAALQPLDDLYLTVLEIAFPANELSRDSALHQALVSTLGSLVVLRNPMSPAVLEALTGVPRKDICTVLGRLRAVVLFDKTKPDEKFREMHSTFLQFLGNSDRCKNKLYRVDARRQHARLAVGCLRALQALEENMCHRPDPLVRQADVSDLVERPAQFVPEHVQYACVHWAAHLRDACKLGKDGRITEPDKDVGETLAAFAQTQLRMWVEMMAYMGRLDAVTATLDAARAYLKGASQYQEVDLMLVEAQQLVFDR